MTCRGSCASNHSCSRWISRLYRRVGQRQCDIQRIERARPSPRSWRPRRQHPTGSKSPDWTRSGVGCASREEQFFPPQLRRFWPKPGHWPRALRGLLKGDKDARLVAIRAPAQEFSAVGLAGSVTHNPRCAAAWRAAGDFIETMACQSGLGGHVHEGDRTVHIVFRVASLDRTRRKFPAPNSPSSR